MKKLTVDEIIRMHEKVIATTGGSFGLRDFGMLESAVYSADAGYDDVEQYATIPEKAARLCYALVKNHAFVDGNKRIGILVMLMTLRLNGIALQYTQAELISLGLSIADGTSGYRDVLAWVTAHTV